MVADWPTPRKWEAQKEKKPAEEEEKKRKKEGPTRGQSLFGVEEGRFSVDPFPNAGPAGTPTRLSLCKGTCLVLVSVLLVSRVPICVLPRLLVIHQFHSCMSLCIGIHR